MFAVCPSGIVTSSQMFSSGYGGAVFAGIIMLIIGLMFGGLAALDFVMLLRVSLQEIAVNFVHSDSLTLWLCIFDVSKFATANVLVNTLISSFVSFSCHATDVAYHVLSGFVIDICILYCICIVFPALLYCCLVAFCNAVQILYCVAR